MVSRKDAPTGKPVGLSPAAYSLPTSQRPTSHPSRGRRASGRQDVPSRPECRAPAACGGPSQRHRPLTRSGGARGGRTLVRGPATGGHLLDRDGPAAAREQYYACPPHWAELEGRRYVELSAQAQGAQIKTFLIADVRGYTVFTQERGDETAAQLAGRFADVVREVVEAREGRLIELRGDEALVVFDSARQAMRTAVELQGRFVDRTLADPAFPLTVGIGIDAGEAVPLEGGYRGGALNLAARLCGQASAGECLASREAVHLARRVDGVRYADRGVLDLKGLAEPVHVMRVLPEVGDPANQLAPFVSAPAPPPRRGPDALIRGHPVGALVAAIALVVAAAAPLTLLDGGAVTEIGDDAVAIIDPQTGEIAGAIELEGRPGALVAGEGAVWVTQPDRGIVVRIDPERR